MRIAIVTAWYPSEDNPLYGIFIQNQAQALASHCDVYVLLLKWSLVPYSKEWKDGKLTIIEKGSFYFPNASEVLLNFWAGQYLRFFKAQHKKKAFDLVHCHDHYASFVGSKIKDTMGLPIVSTIHNSEIMNDTLVAWQQSYLPKILKRSNCVIAVGKGLANVLEQKYKINNVKVIPNFVDTDLFDIQPKEKNKEFSFLFVGGLETHKGVFKLVKAFKRVAIENTSLHIVGSGYLLQRIEDFISKNQLEDKVFLYGALANDSLPDIYNSCHAYVSASEYETFGITVIEAMSCGLPVLYTNSGGPNHTVDENTGIELKDFSVEAIADGLVEMYQNYTEFNPIKIRQHALTHFGWDKSIGVLLVEYKRQIEQNS